MVEVQGVQQRRIGLAKQTVGQVLAGINGPDRVATPVGGPIVSETRFSQGPVVVYQEIVWG